MSDATHNARQTSGWSGGNRWTKWVTHILAALVVMGCVVALPVEPVQAQYRDTSVNYYGGHCRICSGQTYACSNGHGSWQSGSRSFRDPIGSRYYVTRVHYWADGVFGCSGNRSYIQHRLNSWHFYNRVTYGQCRCYSCDGTNYAVSGYYSTGLPGYRYNTNNTVNLRLSYGLSCISRVRVRLEYRTRSVTCYRDYDRDGYGDPRVSSQRSSCSSGWVTNRSDCYDYDRNIRPGAPERCNGRDDDCDGRVDEGIYRYYYLDNDRDGYGTGSRLYRCSPYRNYTSSRSDDCNDGNRYIYPGAREVCNNIDDDCDGVRDEGAGGRNWYYDYDRDGYGTSAIYQCRASGYYRATRGGDCDDRRSYVNPGRAEVCGNGLDDNCNGQVDENMRTYYRDADRDGWGNRNSPRRACSQPSGYTTRTHDCDDGRNTTYPGAREICDGRDNDCDGAVDEGLKVLQYRDADRDGYGAPGSRYSHRSSQQYLYSRRNPVRWYYGYPLASGNVTMDIYGCGDINSSSEYFQFNLDGSYVSYIFRYGTGTCWIRHRVTISESFWNARARDGSLRFDFYRSGAMGGAHTYFIVNYARGPQYLVCRGTPGYSERGGDCNDSRRDAHPGHAEVCGDRIDNDCDGAIDENIRTFYRDNDRDGYGTSSGRYCSQPSGWATRGGDCNDSNPSINPGAREICDNLDNDCDRSVDEGYAHRYYYNDQDRDGWGTTSRIYECKPYGTYTASRSGDCHDGYRDTYPGAREICGDGRDNNCNGQIDENRVRWYYDYDRDGYGSSSGLYCSRPGSNYSTRGGDCNDRDRLIYPGAREICDGKDNDCDRQIDENLRVLMYRDADQDGYGVGGGTYTHRSSQQYLYSSRNPVRWIYGYPTASSNVTMDIYGCGDINSSSEYFQFNLDGSYVSYIFRYGTGTCWIRHRVTISSAFWNARAQDGRLQFDFYRSGAMGGAHTYFIVNYQRGPDRLVCPGTPGYANRAGDCNDGRSNVNPGHAEVCGDGLDNNCNGQIDENIRTWYRDLDGDGYGTSSVRACTQPSRYTTRGGDCNDNDRNIHPGAREVCDYKDNNCRNGVDEGLRVLMYRDNDRDGYGRRGSAYSHRSTQQYLYSSRNPVRWVYGYPTASGNVTMDVYGCGDINSSSEYFQFNLDGSYVSYIFRYGTGTCWIRHRVTISESFWNARAQDGRLQFDFYRSGSMGGAHTYFIVNYTRGPDQSVCPGQAGYSTRTGDCDDNRSNVHPGHAEICGDGLDNNCNGQVDENIRTWYRDYDGDSYGSSSVRACTRPSRYTTRGGDCDDNNRLIHPGAREICDNRDNNCNGQTDEGLKTYQYRDADSDGYGVGASYTHRSSQQYLYSSRNPVRWIYGYPTASGNVTMDVYGCGDINSSSEYFQFNLDGSYVSYIYRYSTGTCWIRHRVTISESFWNARARDGRLQFDFYRSGSMGGAHTYFIVNYQRGPSHLVCPNTRGYATRGGDCDDNRSNVNPGHAEVCGDRLDNNCNGQIDENIGTFYADADGDGYGNPSRRLVTCTRPGGYVTNNRDCADNNRLINPAAREICDNLDNDCDGSTDEGYAHRYYYYDADGDTYGTNSRRYECKAYGLYRALRPGDCLDNYADSNPGRAEICGDGRDNNCNGQIDENLRTFYRDADGDGYGGTATRACTQPRGYVTRGGDCNDSRGDVNPGRTEICNGIDDNCRGGIDEGLKVLQYRDRDQDGYGTGGARYTHRSSQQYLYSRRNPVRWTYGYPQATGNVTMDVYGCGDINSSSEYFQFNLDGSYVSYIFRYGTGTCWIRHRVTISESFWNARARDGSLRFDFYRSGAMGGAHTYFIVNYTRGPDQLVCPNTPGYANRAGDCDDARANVNPGHAEVCGDRLDNNCNGQIDENTRTWYQDRDGDGYGDPGRRTTSCTAPRGYVASNTDCNDSIRAINPGATEICDNVDNDCDRQIDEGIAHRWYYYDADGDSYGRDNARIYECKAYSLYRATRGGDCNDNTARARPGLAEVCGDGLDNNCNGQIDENRVRFYLDRDADGYGSTTSTLACTLPRGYSTNNRDCNDNNGGIHPGATEICNNVDDDCDRLVDEGLKVTLYRDRDGDSYGQSRSSYTYRSSQQYLYSSRNPVRWTYSHLPNAASPVTMDIYGCGDINGSHEYFQFNLDGSYVSYIYRYGTGTCWIRHRVTIAADFFNARNQDRSLRFDFYRSSGMGGAHTYFILNYTSGSEQAQVCPGTAGYTNRLGDCDDRNRNVNPGRPEICGNRIDDNCNNQIDENTRTFYRDADGDTYGTRTTTRACTRPSGYADRPGDCNDNNRAVNPGVTEVCNGIDDDCNDGVDEGLRVNRYLDRDRDGYAQSTNLVSVCPGTPGYADRTGDCDDTNANVHPNHPEVCGNGLDDNCNGQIDENLVTYYLDRDGDTYGTDSTTRACTRPNGYALRAGDCDDTNPRINPVATEVCDNVDNNCDSRVDEGLRVNRYADADRDGYGRGSAVSVCANWAGYSTRNDDCNDGNAAINPGAAEVCDNVDNNCRNGVDEGLRVVRYRDLDGDGYGAGAQVSVCPAWTGYSTRRDDCNDRVRAVNPGAAEVCGNNIDDNCDGQIDENKITYYRDRDGDTWGDRNSTTRACSQPSGYVSRTHDCDDTRNNVFPGANEVCDHLDNNCNGRVDEGVLVVRYRDADGDGYGNVARNVCDGDDGYVARDGDCNDAVASINPGAPEVCGNNVDDNCNGQVDENKLTFYIDRDSDGYGDRGVPTLACTRPNGFSARGDDCDDRNVNVNPGATEVCNHIDDDCDGDTDEGVLVRRYRDTDGDNYGTDQAGDVCPDDDGWAAVNGDCNDGNAAVNPGADEVCNFIDDNCNGQNDEGLRVNRYRDQDDDGFGGNQSASVCVNTPGYSVNNRDCNDADENINPDADEICGNNVDDNCNGQVDENKLTFYLDRDDDGFGSTTTILSCTRPNGYVTNNRDCNDGNAAINPNATEVCDHVDNDCDTLTDEGLLVRRYEDRDGDNYGTSRTGNVCPDDAGWAVATGDCDDTRTNVNPGHAEICGDNLDNNCNGAIDENKNTYYRDADSDGYGDSGLSRRACTQPSGYVTDNTDCDDAIGAVNPGATEVCNGRDDNCDNRTDEGLLVTLYRDFDGDSFGDPNTSASLCPGTGGYVTDRTDCNDRNATIRPNASEICDGVDQNCNNQIDEGLPTRLWYLDVDGDDFGLSNDSQTNCRAIGNYRATVGNDCNDRNDAINPDATEVCGNGVDDNCNGQIDENKVTYYRDLDSDTYGSSSIRACTQPNGYVLRGGDCDDNAAAVNPGATEVCNNIDDNCDGNTDEGLRVARYVDADRDGYGTNTTAQVCPDWAGYAQRNGDCDDTRTNVNPGHAEVCGDGLDNNCNGTVDENLITYYRDEDGDGYGNANRTTQACTPPTGYVTDRTDCNDRSDQAHPGGTEVCDNLDNDCNGSTDESLVRVCSTDCGDGTETCNAGTWESCTARTPTPETCDGEDNDCDGEIDGFNDACRSICGGGLAACTDGQFGACNAQVPETEVCDGLDNDCDGVIDDGVSCGCQYFPKDEAVAPAVEWMWSGSDSHSTYKQVISTPIVANLSDDNNDGAIDQNDTPEILFVTTELDEEMGGYLRAVNGNDGSERWVYDDRKVFGTSSPAVGDLDGDGVPEVVAYAWRNQGNGAPNDAGLIAVDNEGNEIWNNRDVNQGGHEESGSPAIADIDPNSPGAEIATCFWLVSSNGTTLWNRWNDLPEDYTPRGFCSPAVADVDNDGRMEIVIGARAYNHDGSIAWTNTQLYAEWNSQYDIAPAVADLDGDGRPEVVVVRGSIYVLDGQNGALKARLTIPGGGQGGAPNLADFDGDGKPDIGVAGAQNYVAVKYALVNNVPTLSTLWTSTIQDFSTAVTGSSTFDFNGDDTADVVYNDENYLRVFDGRTGAVVFQERNWSGTRVEYPVIADVDHDGNAEIVVARNQIGGFEDENGVPAGLLVYGDANDNWVNTRGIWNQYSYHVTNVRDNGYIPPTEVRHWTNTATNGFRNNFKGEQGLYDAADATVTVSSALSQGGDNGNYPDTDVAYCDAYNKITVSTCNEGDADIPAGMEVSIYVGHPRDNVVAATGVTSAALAPTDCEEIELSWNSAVDGRHTLYLKTDAADAHNECDEDNNIHTVGSYEMTPVGTEKCDGKDNDCDQNLDEDEAGDPLSRACNGEGECGGDVECVDGVWELCNDAVTEVCDGLDNDCDGSVDESPDACGDGVSCLEIDGEYNCVEALNVNDECGFGCPLGTVCSLDDGAATCMPHCESDLSCPDGMYCSDENLCEVEEGGELGLMDLDYDESLNDRERVETPLGACSAPSFAQNAAPAGGFLLLMLGALGYLVIRRQ